MKRSTDVLKIKKAYESKNEYSEIISNAFINQRDFDIEYRPILDLEEWKQKSIFEITKKNVKHFYNVDSIIWDDLSKKQEIFADTMRVIIITSKNKTVVGFSSFDFSFEETIYEHDIPVLYCYEIQIRPEYSRKGLGKCLIEAMVNIGKYNKMEKLMLTNFKGKITRLIIYFNLSNTNARYFYAKNGFLEDEISPDYESDSPQYGYEILSISL
ncbi:N-alpha-acetyltransferase 40 [Smittium culicis]|uniref:N-alpha-acetyltransferase 40 n=1 Tax=Smittium culicis TaxID=133412 RepID=A0A1R1XJ27_9FUNG|nr:N-alpha-acetyltransferase 40 [Smittium culicis]